MKMKDLTPEMLDVLRESHFAYLCTTDWHNQSHITPMFFIFHDRTRDILVFTNLKSKKMENMRVNPKVCLTVDVRDPQNPFENRGVMVQGEATIEASVDAFSITQDERLMKIYKEFRKKYPVLRKAPASIEGQAPARLKPAMPTEALVKVRPNKMVYWRGPHFVTVSFL